MNQENRKKIWFASDFHLGAPDEKESLIREKKIVRWLDEASRDAKEIFILGDIFDFWFEYKRAVPRGYTRLLGKISEITDNGIPVHIFTGNHDMWIFDYLPKECGITLHRKPIERTWDNVRFFIGHGDGLGPGDHAYKVVKKFFDSKVCQWLFARFHPNFGIWLANRLSRYSRKNSGSRDRKFLGEEKEWLAIFAKEKLKEKHFDYFIFGHRHLPLDIQIAPGTRYVNLGDWLDHFTYAIYDGEKMELKRYSDQETRSTNSASRLE